ncbi:hypothetical protein DSO57_1006642 [Entomophthora muscae]|uniref:Uncharacterized protein n=1 Tax=Entomophthora muscae TaxID=34485 RepID=A0ACC2U611_9FUNG|nr:hypothetical protein DSO57_1006642 [Entomophthora muscae]
MISFRKDRTIADFVNCFYLEAQILTSSGSLTVHDTHIALRAAVKPYEALYQTLMPAFQDKCTLDSMSRPVSNYSGRLEAATNNNKSPPKPNITKKGHYTSSCNTKTGIHCGVEEELSTSTQSTNVPPDLLFSLTLDSWDSQEDTKEVSNLYACLLLDDMSDTEPQRSGDATPLRGINVAIPMKTMKDHYPELCDSIVKFLSSANNLDIH